ncbi:hypothetical protein GALMADRAFT_1122685 [Galerina marginata CBS 339.88]|uniref:hAT-like transposase RNase-H fold domain-containing protein n=1 Tax=Galerina marginata (strain CBS 339.88) TaxID=685588 RepID=A0A067TD56_GALM3|nr:hypothetical protein GALMADRAFT_1122685 [Galerina marginata CBS 339.88]
MVEELEDLLPGFSRVNHTRCFLHVNNLVARTLVRQFDVPKAKPKPGAATDDADDDPDKELRDLAGDIDLEERQPREALLEEIGDDELGPDDDSEEWIDEMAALSQAEREGLQNTLRPVRMILVKIRKIAFKTIHSTTLLLPAWAKCLEDLNIPYRIIPRDVQTRRNSTFDMLWFAYEHQKAIDKFTGDRKKRLAAVRTEGKRLGWVKQLCDILEVLKHATLFFSRSTPNLANVIPVIRHIYIQ